MSDELEHLKFEIEQLWWECHDIVETNIGIREQIEDIERRISQHVSEFEKEDVQDTRQRIGLIERNIELERDIWECSSEEKKILAEMETLRQDYAKVINETIRLSQKNSFPPARRLENGISKGTPNAKAIKESKKQKADKPNSHTKRKLLQESHSAATDATRKKRKKLYNAH